MNHSEIIDLLGRHGVKPTPNRLLVAKALADAESPVSLGELETLLDTVDKSGISRTLALFRRQHLVHDLQDGSEAVRYELCHSHGDEEDDDLHVHFHCTVCGKTYCLHECPVPTVSIPEGFAASSASHVIMGVCPSCR